MSFLRLKSSATWSDAAMWVHQQPPSTRRTAPKYGGVLAASQKRCAGLSTNTKPHCCVEAQETEPKTRSHACHRVSTKAFSRRCRVEARRATTVAPVAAHHQLRHPFAISGRRGVAASPGRDDETYEHHPKPAGQPSYWRHLHTSKAARQQTRKERQRLLHSPAVSLPLLMASSIRLSHLTTLLFDGRQRKPIFPRVMSTPKTSKHFPNACLCAATAPGPSNTATKRQKHCSPCSTASCLHHTHMPFLFDRPAD